MNRRDSDERIALLLAQGQAQRLAAQLAIVEAREQLAPLRAAAGFIGSAAQAFSPGRHAAGIAGVLTRFGIDHPWVSSALAAVALRALRRRPLAFLLAAGVGAGAWWLLQARRGSGAAPEVVE